ncbi:hypothetical protein [uncultured Bacteroides sp.]|uniref:hypothetical protein n=1 Tax=uncultured Bacteroides sp. TaxID=162156 RepID=UPI0025F75D84|nr:hypothetical protein [uncultured Bacteroides sp.]
MNRIIIIFFSLLSINQTMMADQFDTIFAIAKRAPSSHNAQMWKIEKIDSCECTIFIDNSVCLPQIDPNNRESWISIGAFVENCVDIGCDLGYDIAVQKYPQKVQLRIVGRKKEENLYIPLINNRHTSRISFERKILDKQLLQFNNCLYIPRLCEQGQKIADNIFDANKQQIGNKKKAKELSEWMITSHKELHDRKDGLTPDMLGMHGFKKFLFLSLFNKHSIQSSQFEKQYLSSTRQQLDNCSGFLILFSKRQSREDDWFNTGRELERIWLDLTKKQIAVHPMSQSIEELDFYNNLKIILNDERDVQMILRVGYTKSSLKNDTCSKRREIHL